MRVGSAEELKGLSVAVGLTFLVILSAVTAVGGDPRLLPLSVPSITAACSLVIGLGFRLAIRSQREGAIRARTGQRALVFGVGSAEEQLIRSMLGDPASPHLPVGLLDDDPTKRHVRIRGVRRMGNQTNAATAARATGAEILINALPSADAALVRILSQRAAGGGMAVKVLPRMADLLSRRIGIRDVRDINVADLLGRRQIDTNVNEIAHYLRGRKVLVTGAGGSISVELCRQIQAFEPGELPSLDRDESALQALFIERQPGVLFHAAALKHVNMLERYPHEGWKTNVVGSAAYSPASVGSRRRGNGRRCPRHRPCRGRSAAGRWPATAGAVSSKPGSERGARPPASMAAFSGSTSMRVTSWPSRAMDGAGTAPR